MVKEQKYRTVTSFLQENGWKLLRQGKGSHEIWWHPGSGDRAIVPHHKNISAGVLQGIGKHIPLPKEWR